MNRDCGLVPAVEVNLKAPRGDPMHGPTLQETEGALAGHEIIGVARRAVDGEPKTGPRRMRKTHAEAQIQMFSPMGSFDFPKPTWRLPYSDYTKLIIPRRGARARLGPPWQNADTNRMQKTHVEAQIKCVSPKLSFDFPEPTWRLPYSDYTKLTIPGRVARTRLGPPW